MINDLLVFTVSIIDMGGNSTFLLNLFFFSHKKENDKGLSNHVSVKKTSS